MKMSTLNYDTLNHPRSQIRLFTLLPSEDKMATIRGSLKTTDTPLKELEYEAVSYTWGDQAAEHSIIVDNSELSITQNLVDTLRHLRHASDPRVLWVDAICINQLRDEEKKHQICRMLDIYSNASRVLMWIGLPDEDTDYAIDCLQNGRPKILCENAVPVETRVRLGSLFHRTWWSRIWVVQESVAASASSLLVCGEKSVLWTTIQDTIVDLSVKDMFGGDQTKALPDATTLANFFFAQMLSKTGKRLHLGHLLDGTLSRQASDPRDHVFALLNLVSHDTKKLFEPDYSKPASWVNQQTMVNVCEARQDLEWLVYAIRDKTADRPSWCADFLSKPWTKYSVSRRWRPGKEPKENDGEVSGLNGNKENQSTLSLHHNAKNGTIKVKGIEIGRIKVIDMPTCSTRDRISAIQIHEDSFLESMEATLDDLASLTRLAVPAWKRRLGEKIADEKILAGDVWKTAAVGLDFSTELVTQHIKVDREVPGYELLQQTALIMQNMEQMQQMGVSISDYCSPKVLTTALIGFAEIANNFSRGKCCFFLSDTDYIGAAGHNIQAGDILCRLIGCHYPAVLRPDGAGSYMLVDLTYTDGLMEENFLKSIGSATEKEYVLV